MCPTAHVALLEMRCVWQCGRRGADVDGGLCQMSKAAAAGLPFKGTVVTCATCERVGCLDCVEALASELGAWLKTDIAD